MILRRHCMRIERNQLTQQNLQVILAKGSFGDVSLQTYHGADVAVKQFCRQSSEEDILREILLPIVYAVSDDFKMLWI